MSSTVFTNGVTLTDAAWFNDVDSVTYDLFGNGTSYTGALTLGSSGNITVNTNKFTVAASTGNTVIAGTLGLSGALTYGGVTLSNAVTGTGNMVLSASPTLTGTLTGVQANFTKATLGDVITFTNGGTTPKTGYLYSGPSQIGLFDAANTGGNGIFIDNSGSQVILQAAATMVATVSSTGVSVTGTLSSTGDFTMGAAGTDTGATRVIHHMYGGSGALGGGYTVIYKNNVAKNYIGVESAVNGGTSDDLTLYGVSGSNVRIYGSASLDATFGGGVQFGAPTGGAKGVGTLNVAADIYKNNTAYTNPDYVLEHWATGQIVKFADKDGAKDYTGLMSLKDTEAFARQNLHLPRFGQQAEHGLFSGSDALLASVEEAYLHLFDHDSRIADLLAWKAKAETALTKAGISV